jgi:excisionase family DNA binding protein
VDSKRGFVILVLVLSIVAVISNVITAQYISYKVENKIRMEMESISHQITQIQRQNQPSITYNNSTREKKWNEVMAPTELAQYLDIELDQVYDIIDNKESGIPYVCIDGAYRFSKDAINEWLASQKSIIINSIR